MTRVDRIRKLGVTFALGTALVAGSLAMTVPATDYHSAWFTRLCATYKTPSWTAASQYGWPRAARVDHAKR